MTVNVGTIDRLLRLVIGVILIALPFAATLDGPVIGYGLPAVGVVLVLTAALRFCPLYRIIGMRTCAAP